MLGNDSADLISEKHSLLDRCRAPDAHDKPPIAVMSSESAQALRPRCSRLGGACSPSDNITELSAKGRSLKRRDLSAIHPEQDRFVRARDPFRRAPSFGSFLRHGVETYDAIKSVVRLGIRDSNRARRSQEPL